MSSDYCYEFVCFVPLDANAPKFFGFSEFLAGLALMVLAWTIADVRYRFRVRTAPLPLQGITFAVVAAVGVLTLLTDLWRAEQWLVPQGNVLTPATWQALLGGLFLLTFLAWAWFAFIRPPVYGRRNAERYAQTLYRVILKGSPAELAVIADEFAYSARSLIRYATDRGKFKNFGKHGESDNEPQKEPAKVTGYANDILLLIADKRFCRAIVESSPGTALAVFHEIGETKKYGIQVETFAKNIVNEALANRDSFLFHETEGYESGLIGYHKPLSQAMFSNHRMVEAIGTLLDPDIWEKGKWDSAQWKAYVVLMTFRDYVAKGLWSHSFVLYRAKGYIEDAAFDLYKINGLANSAWDDDAQAKLRVVVEFIKDAVEILDKKEVPDHLQLRVRERHGRAGNFYDHLASMIFEVIFSASAVRSPADLCWWVQHNSVWGELFNFNRLDGVAGRVVKFKVRRLIYDEVASMKRFPNFKGAKILGFCVNVMGLAVRDQGYDHGSKALQKAILSWTKKNYAWLHSYNPRVAEACLVDGITYDAERLRLVKTYPAAGLRREPHYVYFDVDSPSPDVEKPA
ncbi:MAG: hypothetical protein ACREV3_10810 [Gammaproteobacteria bacterium]